MLTEIRTRIAQQLNIPVDNITADSKLVDDLKADSLDIVELVTSLEEEYNIEISDEDIKNIRTVFFFHYGKPILLKQLGQRTRFVLVDFTAEGIKANSHRIPSFYWLTLY